MYPIPSTETYRNSDKYLWYDGFRKEAMSYIDEDKNIFVHESCVNLSQEEHSQYIPFEMDRYYHGIDLMEMTLQIYFVNSQMGANISEPINVQYSDNRIRFGWLVDRNATAVSGTLMFEIRAIGTVEYEGTGNGKNLQYVWKTHPNSQITILKSLAGDTTFVPTEDWYHKLVATINKQTNDTLAYKNDAADSASEADASEKAALASENEARKQATNSKNSANASEASAQRSEASAVRAESWAVGGTNSRSGEDQNNAKYWCLTTEEMLDTFKAGIAADVKNLEDEIARAKAAEEDLSNRIVTEQDRSTTVESTWSDRLNAEKTRAEGAENVLTTNLASEVSRATSAENTLATNLTSEISRATNVEDTLQLDIVNESTRAQTAEEGLSSRVTSEENRAKNAEATLTTNLASEVSRATGAEGTLQSNIDTEKTRAINAENTLTSNLNTINVNLSTETTRATNAEGVLSDRINAENTRALGVESTLTANLNATNTALSEETSRAMGAENVLSTRMTNAENTLVTLVGVDTGKSVRAIANEELVAQLIPGNAEASMDSLQEIASWISNHPANAATMNLEIEENAANISVNAAAITGIQSTMEANKVEIDAALTSKADVAALNAAVTNINAALDSKANASSVEVLSESVTALSSSLSNKANIADVNEALGFKADAADIEVELDLKASKADVTTALEGKADSDHVHNYIHIGTEEPTDASVVLWIDPVNGLKYYDGSAWVNVPMATN